MSFPLFRLPHLAIIVVFKNLSHEALFILSISTIKAKHSMIRTYLPEQYKTAHFHLCTLIKVITDNDPCHFRIFGLNTESWPKEAIKCSIGKELAAVHQTMGQMDFYWSHADFHLAISSFISQMVISWNCPKVSVTFGGFYDFTHFSILMEELKRNNLEIESIYILKNELYGTKLETFFLECKEITSKLSIDSEIDSFFKTRHSRGFLRVKELEIRNCSWAFIEDFMECRSIKIECVNIEANFGAYINNFIRKWMNDFECKLEIVTITNCPFNFEQITHRLSGKGQSRSVEVGDNSLKIKRKDGKHFLITLIERVLKIELIFF
ncbi:hypothetical protein CAEBREN_18194 [Caenorhabditis brenneri]|uniref:F-box domain-containing protein n=1 Tax=Caenorhabditis brenneri TaxID=135651 RepID=G0N668_CAEBE|nr:hypothetical protein CAEBREN_18194 [Caenorhabditis brenneri]